MHIRKAVHIFVEWLRPINCKDYMNSMGVHFLKIHSLAIFHSLIVQRQRDNLAFCQSHCYNVLVRPGLFDAEQSDARMQTYLADAVLNSDSKGEFFEIAVIIQCSIR